jgi:ribosomal protein L11 methylase PrmA
MPETQLANRDQESHWNDYAGRTWAGLSDMLDRVLEPFEALLIDEVRPVTGARILDVGCGAGAVTLAAAKLGARQVWAVDLDARALAVTCDNAAKNEVLDLIIPLPPERANPPQPVDIVIANILAGSLPELAARFAKLTVIGGRVVLSGILAEQAEECLAAYAPWFTMDQLERREEWCLLAGVRRHGVDCPLGAPYREAHADVDKLSLLQHRISHSCA